MKEIRAKSGAREFTSSSEVIMMLMKGQGVGATVEAKTAKGTMRVWKGIAGGRGLVLDLE